MVRAALLLRDLRFAKAPPLQVVGAREGRPLRDAFRTAAHFKITFFKKGLAFSRRIMYNTP
jgi:hypothetical protein